MSADFLLFLTLLLGLMIGSFLNVVIYRLPVMLKKTWREECIDFMNLDKTTYPKSQATFNLCLPRSHCPNCKHTIRWWENLPVLSYCVLKGRCSQCQTRIAFRYPFIELLTALLSVFIVWHSGFTLTTCYTLLFTWILLAITVIDLDHLLIPDSLSLGLLWTGLLINLNGTFAPLPDAVIGAAAGYGFLWVFVKTFETLTGKEAMGHGDFKLFAAFGAWLGWQQLPFILLAASLIGALVGLALILFKKHDRQTPIPFGPYLAAAGWVALLWGQELLQTYLTYAGLVP